MTPLWAVVFMVNALTGAVTVDRADFGSDLQLCQTEVAYAAMQTYVTKIETNCPAPNHELKVVLTRRPRATWCSLEKETSPEARETGCVVETK